MLSTVVLSFLFLGVHTLQDNSIETENSENFLLSLQEIIKNFNHIIAESAWDSMMDPTNLRKQLELEDFAGERLNYINRNCKILAEINGKYSNEQQRLFEILCTGMKFDNPLEQREYLEVSSQIQYIYTTTRICIPSNMDICIDAVNLWNNTYVHLGDDFKKLLFNSEMDQELLKKHGDEKNYKCYFGEPQLEKASENDYSSISTKPSECKRNNELINAWIWEAWRQAIGPEIRNLYPKLISIMNKSARKAGFSDIGKLWQNEMEIENVEDLMSDLLNQIQPFYKMLHAFVKSILEKDFKSIDGRHQNIPAHFLGWNANWYHLLKDYIEPKIFSDKWNIDDALSDRKWESIDVIKKIEDFYTSLGLSPMTKDFWNKSVISDHSNMNCHGTAANMFKENDYRMVVCGYKRFYDLYVITHEMGHIEQYMMSRDKVPVFQNGNTVIQETIGDSIFLGLITPMHMNRLKLIDDSKLFPSDQSQSNSFDIRQLLIMALMKLPEIPYGYVLEKYRYDLFAQRIDVEKSNDYFWELTKTIQLIEPFDVNNNNRHTIFDAAAKFHFAANIPYARYFFANILQYQIFRGMCEITIYDRVTGSKNLSMPLHKCDIYGSRRAGKLLKKWLKNGNEISLKTILKNLTGKETISADSLLEYYQPLIDWLKFYLTSNNINY